VAALGLAAGCTVSASRPSATVAKARIEVAFAPEALVVKAIASAEHSLRRAGYVFSSPVVVQALLDARKHDVDVQVLGDEKCNRGRSSTIAMKLIANSMDCRKLLSSSERSDSPSSRNSTFLLHLRSRSE
jgi:phosphatidylserine/phosphatidylglycerophosphate/cardiolipin synthase-like enzyme